jgi:hypothetical protein
MKMNNFIPIHLKLIRIVTNVTPSGKSRRDLSKTANSSKNQETMMKKPTFQFQLLAMVVGSVCGVVNTSWAATINAASCSQSAVQAAVNSASDGDKVLIPNGSCSWSTGISTTKQIRIEAQNYTPTPGGNTTRNVIITNNSPSMPLFGFTTGNSYHVGLSGIRFNEGTGSSNALEVVGSGSKVALVNDIFFENKDRYGDSAVNNVVDWSALGGVIWNSRWVGVGPTGAGYGAAVINSPRGWNTPSTMGSLDTNGSVNLYVEDSSSLNSGGFFDFNYAARVVIRYNTIDGASGTSHGFTGQTTGRHVEYYNNKFSVTTAERNHVGRYYWIRGGTALFTDNIVNNASEPGWYGNVSLLTSSCSETNYTCTGAYPCCGTKQMQAGWGHNGTNYVSDPVYVWNNTGFGASLAYGDGNYIQVGRDIIIGTPKPGYAKYIYPHPLRTSGSPATPVPPLSAPTNLRLQ